MVNQRQQTTEGDVWAAFRWHLPHLLVWYWMRLTWTYPHDLLKNHLDAFALGPHQKYID